RLRDDQNVGRIAVNGVERAPVGDQIIGRADAVPGGTELVGGQQAHDRGQVIGYRPAPDNRYRAQVKRGQNIHPPSLPGPGRTGGPPAAPPGRTGSYAAAYPGVAGSTELPAPAAPAEAPQEAHQPADGGEDHQEQGDPARPGEDPQVQTGYQQPGRQRGNDHRDHARPRPGTRPALLPGSLTAVTGSGGRQQCRGLGAWKIAGDRRELALRGCLERLIEAMLELLQGQPALGVVLAQAGGRRFAVGVCDARARFSRHVSLRTIAELAVPLARRYI